MSDGGTLSRAELTRYVRAHLAGHLYEEMPARAGAVAIYALSDPRDIRAARYIGQTASPRRRWLQHVNTARLWLPEDKPWWVCVARLRPLYTWIRELFAEERRLPVMVVLARVQMPQARAAERAYIQAQLAARAGLLNYEAALLADQIPLPLNVPTAEAPDALAWLPSL